MHITWKDKFVERYSKLTDFEIFKEYSMKPLRKSIRVNTLKISIPDLKKRIPYPLTPIPWCKEGFFIEGRGIGNLVEHTLGYFYMQEAASMIPPLVLEPKENEIVLDMAAAPGSKTTQIAAMMKNTGVLIANDVEVPRLKALSINLQRCGILNTVMTFQQGKNFRNLECDKILLDAPCSGTGTIRKSPKTPLIWNPNAIKRLAGMQRQLIKVAFENLKENGTLVYSTCSLEPEENEGVIDFLLKEYKNAKLEKIELNIKRSPAILAFEKHTFDPSIKYCLRLWPQDNDTEGFFVAKIRKITS